MGYELTQTLFIGRHTLLVEGPSDLLYLKSFSRQLETRGQAGLDYRWNISVLGGVDRIPGLVSLFRGNSHFIAAIADVQNGDKTKIDNARKRLPEGHLFTLDKYTGQKESDIEDVIGRDFYSALVTKSLGLQPAHQLSSARPTGASDRVAKEAEEHCRTLPPHYLEFDHFVPAEWLFQNGDEGLNLPNANEALERFSKLISDINALVAK